MELVKDERRGASSIIRGGGKAVRVGDDEVGVKMVKTEEIIRRPLGKLHGALINLLATDTFTQTLPHDILDRVHRLLDVYI